MTTKIKDLSVSIFAFILLIIITQDVFAHCDSMEGPVVKAAKKSIETGNINYVLIWIKEDNENEIKKLFNQVNDVRKLSNEAKELADMYFYETVVRIHRMGEGDIITGLKPAGYKIDEGIIAADLANEENSLGHIINKIDRKYHQQLEKLFKDLISKKNFDINDLEKGREYVEAYVHFIHFVEEIYGKDKEEHQLKHHH